MAEKPKKAVLIADDEPGMRALLKDEFTDCSERKDCPYEFEVDIVQSATECVQKVRTKKYEVIVVDVHMETPTSGMDMGQALSIELGSEMPVMIIFTGYPSYRLCVEAIRYGAWDYIVKEDVGDTPMAQVVVDSAVARLRQLDLRHELEQRIAQEWLPQHMWELQPEYGGKLVAIWHQPEISVVASGSDAFELEANLGEWRNQHATWEQSFLVRIPLHREENEAEG